MAYDLKEKPAADFSGWATNQLGRSKRLFVVEGKPDSVPCFGVFALMGPAVQTRTALRLNFALSDVSAPSAANYFRFDVHPDHKRSLSKRSLPGIRHQHIENIR